ncbi:MAG TPA: cupin domain-containing protein [Terriglobia bacterium]
MSKPELEFFPVSDVGWTPVPGKVSGLHERILARDPKAGVATRMLRFDPGADTSANGTLTHDFWEEVYILEGSIYDIPLRKKFTAGMYACRPPGMKHGPWTSQEGCTTFEVRYFLRTA